MSGTAEISTARGTIRQRLGSSSALATTIFLLLPFLCVCLLMHMFVLAAVALLVGVALLVLARPAQSHRPDATFLVFAVLGSLLLLFLILPVLNLLFTTNGSKILAMARDPSVQAALQTTLGAATIATIIALVTGVPLGFVLAREQFSGKSIVEGIVDMPVAVPQTIAGISLLFVFGRGGALGAPLHERFGILLGDTFWGIVLAMLFVSIPFVVNISRDGFMSVDPRMEYVARSLGASPISAYLRVTLPLTWRSLLSGAIMTWARATSEFGSITVMAYYPKSINTLLFEWYNFFGYTYTKPLAALLLIVALTIFIVLRSIARTRRAHIQA